VNHASEWLNNVYAAMHPPVTCRGSHHEEDTILRALLPEDPVVYVDVGAAEPIQCSNTWQFYEAGGHGLLIEPLPEWWGPLLRFRPRDQLWPTAASDFNGPADFQLGQSGSTLGDRGDIATPIDRTTVEVMRLDGILALFPAIRDACQLCDIDIEGSEPRALRSIDWDVFHPDVVCIEDYDGRYVAQMRDYGYTNVACTVHNIVFVRDDLTQQSKERLCRICPSN